MADELLTPNNLNKKPSTLGYKITICILLISLSIVSWLWYQEKGQVQVIVKNLEIKTDEKENIAKELTALAAEYETLKTNNDTMNARLSKEQEKIQQLIEEIKNVKNSNRYQIDKYKRELSTLRDIMKSYIVQIDSLNTKNKILIAENIEVKNYYQRAQTDNQTLQQKNEDLSGKVQKASVIKATNIIATPLNKRGKETTKASKVTKIQVGFTLNENVIAERGNKIVYMRIARPDELVLATSEKNVFRYEGNEIIYTEKREVDYQGTLVDMTIYWDKNQELIVGVYYVDIFIDGAAVGSAKFTLK